MHKYTLYLRDIYTYTIDHKIYPSASINYFKMIYVPLSRELGPNVCNINITAVDKDKIMYSSLSTNV